MRLIATGIVWVALCGLLQAENSAKPTKPAKPAVVQAANPASVATPPKPTVIETPVDAPYVELKPMKEADKNIRFGKIYDFINDPDVTPAGENKALNYEFKYFNYGAITKEQLKERKGQYYIVNWKNVGAPENLVLRFDYRQQKSREKINTLQIAYPAAKGNLRAEFSVRGEAYEKFGKINSWRITVLRKGEIVAQQQSFIW